jgi:two-component system chemotaxis response regulator CheY
MTVKDLRDVHILIIDEKGHGISLLRSILIQLGVKDTIAIRSTEEALKMLRDFKFDVVFCDELAVPLNPVGFVKALRRDLETKDVTVPVILVSSGANRKQIELVRDAGANDVVAKPVSAETVERKLRQLFFAPQAFVTARTFLGPDRRRSDERRAEPRAGEERRGQREQDANVFVRPPRIKPDTPTS